MDYTDGTDGEASGGSRVGPLRILYSVPPSEDRWQDADGHLKKMKTTLTPKQIDEFVKAKRAFEESGRDRKPSVPISLNKCPACGAWAVDLIHKAGLQYFQCGQCRAKF